MQKHKCKRPLIVLPRRVLENNWNAEIKKWKIRCRPTYIQYASFIKPNKWSSKKFDMIIFDEAHHISERCLKALDVNSKLWEDKPIALLSATVPKDLKIQLQLLFKPLVIIKDTLQQTIEEGVLPKPTICYIRCELPYLLRASYTEIQNKCQDAKNAAMRNPRRKNWWLHQCKLRNEWLACQKNDIIQKLLTIYNEYRMLVFCANIKQAQNLNIIDITSGNKEAAKNLEDFNNKTINTISAVSMLDEGLNLKDCKIALMAYVTISERLNIQRLGRILRHPQPILLFPYFAGTREEEIMRSFYTRFKDASTTIHITEQKVEEHYQKSMNNER